MDRGIETPEVIGEKYLRMLDALSLIDPMLTGWDIFEGRCTMDDLLDWAADGSPEPAPIQAIPLEQARPRMTALVETNVRLDDWGRPEPERGYGLVAVNKYNGTARSVGVSVNAGSEFDFNRWSVSTGEWKIKTDPSLITYPILGGVFRTMTSIWPTPWACVRGTTVDNEMRPSAIVGQTSVEVFRHEITWMGYLSAKLAAGFEPPAELIVERTADGGLLMISDEERPDPANPDQMRRSDLLTQIMDARYPRRS